MKKLLLSFAALTASAFGQTPPEWEERPPEDLCMFTSYHRDLCRLHDPRDQFLHITLFHLCTEADSIDNDAYRQCWMDFYNATVVASGDFADVFNAQKSLFEQEIDALEVQYDLDKKDQPVTVQWQLYHYYVQTMIGVRAIRQATVDQAAIKWDMATLQAKLDAEACMQVDEACKSEALPCDLNLQWPEPWFASIVTPMTCPNGGGDSDCITAAHLAMQAGLDSIKREYELQWAQSMFNIKVQVAQVVEAWNGQDCDQLADSLMNLEQLAITTTEALEAQHALAARKLRISLNNFIVKYCCPDEDDGFSPQQRQLLDALIQVESMGDDNAVGDGGNAIGSLQIWRVYWLDAVEFSDLGGDYLDCFKRQYAEKVVDAYMTRYAKEAWTSTRLFDAEFCARLHNGGPRGNQKKSTEKYWTRVQKQL